MIDLAYDDNAYDGYCNVYIQLIAAFELPDEFPFLPLIQFFLYLILIQIVKFSSFNCISKLIQSLMKYNLDTFSSVAINELLRTMEDI